MLGRSEGGGANVALAENIESLNFVYLDQSGVTTSSIPNIRSVQITLIAKADRDDLDVPLKTLQTEVRCRNLGL